METAKWVQILDEAGCISYSSNTIGNRYDSNYSPSGRLGSLAVGMQPILEKENAEFKPVKVHLKIVLVSHPARVVNILRVTNTLWSGQRYVDIYNAINTYIPSNVENLSYWRYLITFDKNRTNYPWFVNIAC